MAFVVKPEGDSVRIKSTTDHIDGEVIVEFAPGVEAAFGRGSTDSDLTYLRLTLADGTPVHIFASDATTVAATAARPTDGS